MVLSPTFSDAPWREADVGDVMLVASVRAAAHLDVDVAGQGSVMSIDSTRSWIARLRPIEEVMPILQESVPGRRPRR